MVDFLAAVLIVSGFWVLLELGRFLLGSLEQETVVAEGVAGPGREYVERYADAFSRLAESYQDMPEQKEHFGDAQVEDIFQQVHREVCSDCGQKVLCWQEQYYENCRKSYGCLQSLAEDTSGEEKIVDQLADFCIQPEALAEKLRELYQKERNNLLWNNRLLEQRAAAGEQIQDTAQLLHQMSERIYQIRGLKEKERKKLFRELKYEKIQCQNAWQFQRGPDRPEIYVTLRQDNGSCVPAREMGEIISRIVGEQMVLARDSRLMIRSSWDTFHYVKDTAYQMFCGIAKMTKTGELISGDSFAFWQGDQGQVMMSLADGMGSGLEACRESEKVMELLEQFLDAGFSQETAVRMINSSLVLQDHHRIFSTIDLCMIDLYNGICDMIKAGACATYLKRQDTLEVISCQSLPAGVIRSADYEHSRHQLFSGDVIVMMTDGVQEACGKQGNLEDLICKLDTNNAKEYAKRLLEQILLHQKMQARDDMTVLVGRIWDK